MLIFLLGSLGDTLVAIPALRLVARRFPHAERRVLTHFSISEKAAPMDALLANTGLVHGYFRFPAGDGKIRPLLSTMAEVRGWKPDVLVHLHESRGRLNAMRDRLFFWACGVPNQIGIPFSRDLQKPRFLDRQNRYEHRSDQLARRLAALGDAHVDARTSWDLALTAAERTRSMTLLAPLNQCRGILAMSIGTKVDTNDWGNANWERLLSIAGTSLDGWGLVAIGAAVERTRTEALISAWPDGGSTSAAV